MHQVLNFHLLTWFAFVDEVGQGGSRDMGMMVMEPPFIEENDLAGGVLGGWATHRQVN